MGAAVHTKEPCIECDSQQGLATYEDGSMFCFSCKKHFPAGTETKASSVKFAKTFTKTVGVAEIAEFHIRGLPERSISKEVCEFYGVRVSYSTNGAVEAHYYPYDNDKCYKKRGLPKQFNWIGPASTGLFGLERFNGGGKRLIICEGEIDALSMAEASFRRYNRIYPAVAMSSSAMTKSLLNERDKIRSFEEVILCFDEDEAGRKALEEAIHIVGIDKARITKLPRNDANDVLAKDGYQELLRCMFDAAPYIPSGIITKENLWQSLIEYTKVQSLPYPPFLQGFNEKAKGARQGEIALFTSGTSSGKSSLMREIALHFSTEHNKKIGIVALEESPAETARKLSGMALRRNPAEEEISLEELKVGFDQVFEKDNFVLLDHQGSIKDASILDKLEYMALSGCTHIIIDHITILVSEGNAGLTGNEAIDKVMNDLLRFVQRYNVWVGLVSHLRKTPTNSKAFEEGKMPSLDDIKGSGSIKQISYDIFAFARDLMAEDPIARNTVEIAVLKCRYSGLTGRAGHIYYDYPTGRMTVAPVTFTKVGDKNVESF